MTDQSEVRQMGHDQTGTLNTEMTIRRIDLSDEGREAIARLSELDSSDVLEGPVLGVEVEGSLVAAISLTNARVVSDPFSRTAELRSLLELRAAQLRRRASRRERGLRIPRRRSRPAVGGSPAGTIISLPRWG
jgi:hypothetical protein